MFPKSFFKHIVPALLAGLGLRLFFIWLFPFYSGDTAYYEELARNWLYHRVYGFYSNGQLLPSDARAPGYPAFLAGIYFLAGTSRKAVMLAQAFVDLATCVLAAAVADGLAAGETIKVLHEGRETGVSSGPLQALGLGTFASGALMAVTTYFRWIRDTWFLPGMQPMNIGFNFSLLSFGSGLLVGFRICLSMAIGTAISWFILPPLLLKHGMIAEQTFPITLRWVMWPATGLISSMRSSRKKGFPTGRASFFMQR